MAVPPGTWGWRKAACSGHSVSPARSWPASRGMGRLTQPRQPLSPCTSPAGVQLNHACMEQAVKKQLSPADAQLNSKTFRMRRPVGAGCSLEGPAV